MVPLMYERIDCNKSITTCVNFSELQQGAARLECNKDVTDPRIIPYKIQKTLPGKADGEEMLGTSPSIYNDSQSK